MNREFKRLGATVVSIQPRNWGTAMEVTIEGWPDSVLYTVAEALHILRRFPMGHMATPEGDAEVCKALQDGYAVLTPIVEQTYPRVGMSR